MSIDKQRNAVRTGWPLSQPTKSVSKSFHEAHFYFTRVAKCVHAIAREWLGLFQTRCSGKVRSRMSTHVVAIWTNRGNGKFSKLINM